MKTNKLLLFVLLTLLISSFAFATAPDPADTVAYYTFDENTGTTAGDSTPNDYDGTLSDSTMWTSSGKINSGLDFDGINDEVTTTFSTSGLAEISINVWVYRDSTNTNSFQQIYDDRTEGGSGVGASIQLYYRTDSTKMNAFIYTSNTFYKVNGWDIPTNKWVMVTVTYDGSDLKVYKDGVFVDSISATGTIITTADDLVIGNNADSTFSGREWKGKIDEHAIFDKALTSDEISYLYASDSPDESQQYDFPSSNFTITAEDSFYNTTIEKFNATINGTLYQSVNESIVTPYLLNETDILNITVTADNYFDYENESYNTSNRNLQAQLNPSLFTHEVQLYDIINVSKQVLNFTVENRGINYTTTNGTATVEYPTETENITVYADGYLTREYTNLSVAFDVNVTALAQEYVNPTPLFNVTDSLRSTAITNYTINSSSVDYTANVFNFTIQSDNYFDKQIVNENISGAKNYEVNPNNAFYFTAKDQNDLAIINQDIIISLQQGVNERELNISNGQGIIENISAGLSYTLIVSTTDYETRSYTYEHDGNTNPLNNLTVFLIKSSEVNLQDVEFAILDSSNLPIEGVLVTARAFVNGSYVPVSSGETDITGTKTFILDKTKRHQITISKDAYTTREFFIDAPLDTTYTFRMDLTDAYQPNNALKNIIYDIDPQLASVKNTSYTLNFTVTAFDNDLDYFNINVLVRNQTTGFTTNLAFNESTESAGGELSVLANFSDHYGKLAIFKYCLQKEDFNEVCFYANYVVDKDYGDERSFGTLKAYVQDNLEVGERIFFFSVILLITAVFLVAIPFTRNVFAVLPLSFSAIFYGWLFLPSGLLIFVGVCSFFIIISLISEVNGR